MRELTPRELDAVSGGGFVFQFAKQTQVNSANIVQVGGGVGAFNGNNAVFLNQQNFGINANVNI
jgi:hypothetical protein